VGERSWPFDALVRVAVRLRRGDVLFFFRDLKILLFFVFRDCCTFKARAPAPVENAAELIRIPQDYEQGGAAARGVVAWAQLSWECMCVVTPGAPARR